MAETESDIVRIAREYRQQLERNETAAMKEMSRAWVRMERAMRSEFEALAVIISEKAEAGEPVPAQFVYSLKRYQEMLIQLRAEVAKYNNTAEDIIKDKQRENIRLGLDGAGEQLTVSAPVGVEWVKIYPEAAENMVGYAADGSPLKALLERDYQSGAQAVTDALIDGIGLGKGWKAVASDMEKAVGMSFDRSVTIARTEMARAYRQANMRQYEASGVVEKVFRLAYKPTACFACLILDGTEIKGEFEDHPRGKCTSIVQTIGGHRPTWQTGSEWFMEQSAADQRRLMGAGRWELWKDGVIKSLSDFVYIRPNQSWGGSPAVKTFDMLGVQSPLKQPKPAAGAQTQTMQAYTNGVFSKEGAIAEMKQTAWYSDLKQQAGDDWMQEFDRNLENMPADRAEVYYKIMSGKQTPEYHDAKSGYQYRNDVYVGFKESRSTNRLVGMSKNVDTYFHENTHWADWHVGHYSKSADTDLAAKLKKETLAGFNQIMDGVRAPINAWSRADSFSYCFSAAPKFFEYYGRGDKESGRAYCSTLTDMISGFTNGKCGIGYGHNSSYWKGNAAGRAMEFFAEVGDAYFVDHMHEAAMNEFFPESYSRGVELLKEAAEEIYATRNK